MHIPPICWGAWAAIIYFAFKGTVHLRYTDRNGG